MPDVRDIFRAQSLQPVSLKLYITVRWAQGYGLVHISMLSDTYSRPHNNVDPLILDTPAS